jgi:hypothetical protein
VNASGSSVAIKHDASTRASHDNTVTALRAALLQIRGWRTSTRLLTCWTRPPAC